MFYSRKYIIEGSDKYNSSSDHCKSAKDVLDQGRIKLQEIVAWLKLKYLAIDAVKIFLNETTWKPVMNNIPSGGSCFTLLSFPTNAEKILSRIQIKFKRPAKLFIHNPGSLKSGLIQRQLVVQDGNNVDVKLRYEVFKILNTEERPCNDDPEYNLDECFENLTYEESMATMNCTGPLLNNKDNICTDKEHLKEAENIRKKYQNARDERCPEACTFSDITVIANTKTVNNSLVLINYAGQVKVIESYFVYDGISLVAEIGGYVGLFLGYSIKQITEITRSIVQFFKKRCP